MACDSYYDSSCSDDGSDDIFINFILLIVLSLSILCCRFAPPICLIIIGCIKLLALFIVAIVPSNPSEEPSQTPPGTFIIGVPVAFGWIIVGIMREADADMDRRRREESPRRGRYAPTSGSPERVSDAEYRRRREESPRQGRYAPPTIGSPERVNVNLNDVLKADLQRLTQESVEESNESANVNLDDVLKADLQRLIQESV
jgi:hypothetical protein